MTRAPAGESLRLGLAQADLEQEQLLQEGPSETALVRLEAASARAQMDGAAPATVDAVLTAWPLRDEAQPVFVQLAQSAPAALPLVALCSDTPVDQIKAFEAGADVAVVVPLCVPLLRAYLLARQRLFRAHPAPANGENGTSALQEVTLRAGPLALDAAAQLATADGERLDLTPKEFAVLRHLMQHAGACCTRDQILDDVWGINFETGTNMIDVYIYFLRRKLKEHGLKGLIRTVRGQGYRLVPAAPSAQP